MVTLALTAAIVFLTFFGAATDKDAAYRAELREWVRALAALVLLFDIYTMYQHLQLQRVRRQLAEQDALFQLITENAADMIAVVDAVGRRLYNSPAYQKVLGYSAEELSAGSSLDQVHPADRERVLQAAEKARATGHGERLEYRMRHRDGSWRTLESTASPIQNAEGELEKLVIVNRDITERKRAEQMLAHNALHDGLTDLPNRVLFGDRVRHGLSRARRHSDYRFAVLFVDIDEFRVVNDSLGHTAGDQLLIQIAKRLTLGVRESDTVGRPDGELESPAGEMDVARLGGDEFAVLLEDLRKEEDAVRTAHRIHAKLQVPFEIGGQEIVITAGIGVASSASAYLSADEVLRDAELAMHRAKGMGKGRCAVFDPEMHTSAVRRLQLETDLRQGLERGELIVYYQPIVSLQSGTITGFEALSRWRRGGRIAPPAEFIALADETGLIVPLNRALMKEACQQLRAWQSRFGCDPPLTMSFNVSQKQFDQPDLVEEIRALVEQAGVPANTVSLEIMETIAMGNADHALSVLAALKKSGVLLSLDDFGTGYSSLSRLPRFPVDTLKIDRLFISNMIADRDHYEIVRLVITLAHSIGLQVVAEGTETEEQVEALRRLGCEMAQGYLYSPPVDVDAASEFLMRGAVPATKA